MELLLQEKTKEFPNCFSCLRPYDGLSIADITFKLLQPTDWRINNWNAKQKGKCCCSSCSSHIQTQWMKCLTLNESTDLEVRFNKHYYRLLLLFCNLLHALKKAPIWRTWRTSAMQSHWTCNVVFMRPSGSRAKDRRELFQLTPHRIRQTGSLCIWRWRKLVRNTMTL